MSSFVRISISLLVPYLNSSCIGIIDKKFLLKRNVKLVGALGGVSLLYDQKYVREKYGAFDFEGADARFKAPGDRYESLLEEFRCLNDNLFEIDPLREVVEELCEDLSDITAFLKPASSFVRLEKDDFKGASFEYLGRYEERSYSQMDSEILTHRVMHNFRFIAKDPLRKRVVGVPLIRLLSQSELLNRMTHDNIPIKNNVIKISDLVKE